MLQGENISFRSFKKSVFKEDQHKKLANLYFSGLCYKVIKHNRYMLHNLKLNMDREVPVEKLRG